MRTPAFILLASAMLAVAGCGGEQPAASAKSEGRTLQARSEVTALAETPVHHVAPGTVVALEKVEVASRLMGYLRDLAVVEGQAVKRGQRLFTVDPVDVQGQADQARHAVQQAEDAYRDAQADLQRYANLFKEEVVTRQQYDKMKLQQDTAASRLAQAKAGLHTAQGQLRYATVTSPIAGVVTRKLADNGDLASPGQAVLVVENTGRLQVETQVPEDILRRIRPGQTVPVEADGLAQPVQARVANISPAADPVSHTFLVKLDVADPALRSGTFARVRFPLASRQTLSVPAGALVTRAGIDGVFVLGKDGVAQFRMVRGGETRDGRIEIQAGLNPGERIVVEGAERLESGDKING